MTLNIDKHRHYECPTCGCHSVRLNNDGIYRCDRVLCWFSTQGAFTDTDEYREFMKALGPPAAREQVGEP